MARASDGFGGGLDKPSAGGGVGKEIRPAGKENSIDLGGSRGLIGGSQTAGNVSAKRTEDKAWYQKGAGIKYSK
jgi:hypothetical protein